MKTGHYLKLFFALTAVLIAGLIAINWYTCFNAPVFGFSTLRLYQYERLRQAESVDLLLLGDSSLGCSIDPALMEQITEKKTLKLALNGMYGFAGQYNLLNQVVKRNTPETVMLMVTPGMMLSPPSWEGYVYSSESFAGSFVSAPEYSGTILKTWLDVSLTSARLRRSLAYLRHPHPMKVDGPYEYFAPENTAGALGEPSILSLGRFDEKNLIFLKKIRELCDAQNIRLVVAFSPFPEYLYEKYSHRILEQENYLKSAGTPVIPPYMVHREQLADTIYHVRIEEVGKATTWYAGQLGAVQMQSGETPLP